MRNLLGGSGKSEGSSSIIQVLTKKSTQGPATINIDFENIVIKQSFALVHSNNAGKIDSAAIYKKANDEWILLESFTGTGYNYTIPSKSYKITTNGLRFHFVISNQSQPSNTQTVTINFI